LAFLTKFYEILSSEFLGANPTTTGLDHLAFHRFLKHPVTGQYSPETINYLVEQYVDFNKAKHILDAGCGWGGTLAYLAHEHHFSGIGLTVSSQQQSFAAEKITKNNPYLQFLQLNYLDLDELEKRFDLVIMIESFIHCENRELFAKKLAQHTNKTGRLIIVDDWFAIDKINQSDLANIENGWSLNKLMPYAEMVSILEEVGFSLSYTTDLTASMKQRSISDVERELIQAPDNASHSDGAEKQGVINDNLIGSLTLERLYLEGKVKYTLSVFDLVEPPVVTN